MSDDNELTQQMLVMAQALLAATREGKVSWTVTDDENKFLYAGSHSSVTIESLRDRDGDEINVLQLMNSRGSTIDSLSTQFKLAPNGGYTREEWSLVLADLYRAARRVAYDVDAAISSMMEDIERGTPSQPQPRKRVDDPWAADVADSGFSDEPPF